MAEDLREIIKEQELLLETIDTQIWYLIDEETYGKVNKAHADFLGLNKSDIEHKKLGELLLEEETKICIKRNKEVFNKKKKIETEEWRKNSKGEKRLLSITKNPKLNEKDKVEYVVCSAEDITEKKEKEKKLHQMKFSMDNSPIGVFRITPEGEFRYVNDIACENLNYKSEELIGKKVSDIDPNFPNIKRKDYWNQLKENKINTVESYHQTKDGEEIPVLVTSKYLKYKDKEYEFAFVQDITERKKREKELEESRERYQKLFETAPEGMMIEDETGKILEVNEAMTEMTGYLKQELEGSHVCDKLTTYEYKEEVQKNIDRILSGEDLDHEVKDINSEGEIFFTRLKETKITLPEGKPGILSMHIDITQKKRQKLEADALFENSSSAIAKIDSEGNILDINNEFTDIFGYQLEEIKGKNIDDVWEQGRKGYVNRESTEKSLKGRKIRGEGIRYDKDGNPREVLYQGIPVVIEGMTEGSYALYEDITELKEKEKIIESLHGVSLSFGKLTDEKEVCAKTVEAAEKLLQFELCTIDLVEDEMFIPQAQTTDAKLKKMAITDGIAGRAYREGKSFLIDNIDTAPEAKPVKSTYKSGITIPMGEYGVFQAVAEEEAAFTEEDLEVAEILISHATATLGRIYSQEKLKYKTFHDELTGLYNRRFIEEEMKRLDTERQLPISIFMVDINGLKLINDSLGHGKGDELLVKTADILKEAFRDEDILARYGGDEFVILLPQTDRGSAQKVVGRIKRKCKKCSGDNLVVSLGVGLATKTSVKEDIFDILKEADDKMYQNKLLTSESKKNDIVSGLLNALGAKSDETKEHTMRMTRLANRLGESIGASEEQKDKLTLLATLHDIGKISISEEILTKPGKPTEEEWNIIKKHAENGYKIASSSSEFAVVAKDILYHHERWDGSGYPRGLEGEEIPFLARIISIIDAYDVMTNERPYSPVMSKEKALQEIKDCAGSQFDPELAKRFIEIMR